MKYFFALILLTLGQAAGAQQKSDSIFPSDVKYLDTTKLSTAGFVNGVNPEFLEPRPICGSSTKTIVGDGYAWTYGEGLVWGPEEHSQLWHWESTEKIVCEEATKYQYHLTREWVKWVKVPYEIQWVCMQWEDMENLTDVHLIDKTNCTFWLGYRKDGMVVWRKRP